MKRRRGLSPAGRIAGSILAAVFTLPACSSVDQIEDTQSYSTLTVAYGQTGATFSPCDDRLPIVDGIAQDQEWAAAEPLFVRMTGANGTGGDDFFVEIRAVWTDEGKFFGGSNRIYFLLRYADSNPNPDNFDLEGPADLLVYGTFDSFGNLVPSPIPQDDTSVNPPVSDSVILDPASWTRLNPNGREDQILLLLAEEKEEAPLDLVGAGRSVMGVIGPEAPANHVVSGAGNIDVWMWRASRTNRHPVPQFARWGDFIPGTANPLIGECDAPRPETTRFPNTSGFCEDLWIDASGSMVKDLGREPFVKNFRNRDPVPDRITQPIPPGRDPESEGILINCGLPKNLVLWWATSKGFQLGDDIATSRPGNTPRRWSDFPPPGGIDYVQGWGIQTPTGSARDVRARAVHEENEEKGFLVRSLEIMRNLDTGNGDDLVFEPGKAYRIVLGIFNGSGTRASGSTEIRLIFQPPFNDGSRPRDRC